MKRLCTYVSSRRFVSWAGLSVRAEWFEKRIKSQRRRRSVGAACLPRASCDGNACIDYLPSYSRRLVRCVVCSYFAIKMS